MQWDASSSAQGPVGRPAGDIDDGDRDVFLAHLRAGVAEAASRGGRFLLDLAAVDHLSASALMALTMARQDAISNGVTIVLARPRPSVRDVLEISRYPLLFDIVDDPEPDVDGKG